MSRWVDRAKFFPSLNESGAAPSLDLIFLCPPTFYSGGLHPELVERGLDWVRGKKRLPERWSRLKLHYRQRFRFSFLPGSRLGNSGDRISLKFFTKVSGDTHWKLDDEFRA